MKVADKQGGGSVQKTPGRLRWYNITLTRGLSADTALWTWHQLVVDSKMQEARQNCTIVMMGQEGQPVTTWELMNVRPSDLTMSAKGAGEGAVEEITLTPERVMRK